jgi:hypothetical protein
MDEKPRRFRFGLLAIFTLIAAAGVVASFWNPFDRPPSLNNIPLVKTGMTIDEVAELVGEPDYVGTLNATLVHLYETSDTHQQWLIGFVNGKVVGVEQPVAEPPVEYP